MRAEPIGPDACCRTALYADPQELDTVRCPTCKTWWKAKTKPHVGVPTWWRIDTIEAAATDWERNMRASTGMINGA